MSSHLWRAYFENDLGKFRSLLGLQDGHDPPGGNGVAGLSAASFTPPFSQIQQQQQQQQQQRKQPGGSGAAPASARVEQQLLRAHINSRLPPGASNAIASGLTLLHHAATSNNLPFVHALLSHPLTDALAQDYESGWTALHRALYLGNISTARCIMNLSRSEVVKIKDKEGSSPFELYFATISTSESIEDGLVLEDEEDDEDPFNDNDKKDAVEMEVGVSSGEYIGDEVYVWGSNKNVSLGFADGDDRQYPDRAYLAVSHDSNLAMDVFKPLLVKDVQMSKFQTSILTNSGTLFTTGFGHGGRLGLGQDGTEFTFKQVPIEGHVRHIILGQDHTIAIVDDGDVYTYGNGKWGQLGYAVKAAKLDEDPCQLTPRQVYTTLRKEKVIGGAASKWHSVVHTADALYVFGKNEGQLGIVDADSHALEAQMTPRRVAASLVTADILMVTATDTSTAVLYKNHEVWVFSNYGHAKVTFPFDRFPGTNIKVTRPVLRHTDTPNYISKIVSGGETIAALSQMGDVFTVKTDKVYGTGSRGFMTSQRIWSLKKKHMAVKDVDVGQEGSVILCTESGSVWQRVKRPKTKDAAAVASSGTAAVGTAGLQQDRAKDYKFSRVPGLTNIVGVRSSAFGAYAAVRRDFENLKTQLEVRAGSLYKEIEDLLSFKSLFLGENGEPAIHSQADILNLFSSASFVAKLSETFEDADLSGYDAFIEISLGDGDNAIKIPVHSFILAGRSRILRQLISKACRSGKAATKDLVDIKRGENGELVLRFSELDTLSAAILVFYLYNDRLASVWHVHRRSQSQASSFQNARTQVRVLSQKLGLGELESAITGLRPPAPTLHSNLEAALEDPDFSKCADMALELKNGTLEVHSALMCARCPFFDALYRGGSGRWLLSRRAENENGTSTGRNLIKVDMKHVTVEVMRLVLVYLYSDTSVGLFDHVSVDESGINGFLDLLVDVISTANELMLERLSEICQRVLGRLVNTRNVTSLLISTADCSVSSFKDACYNYICMNLEAMLETHALDELDEDLMAELDNAVRERQLAYMPIVRSGKFEKDLFERYPHLQAQCLEERELAIGSMSTSLREDAVSPQSSFKAKGSPMAAPRHRRKQSFSNKDTAAAATVTPVRRSETRSGDMMFDMDDDLTGGSRQKGASLSSSPVETRSATFPQTKMNALKRGSLLGPSVVQSNEGGEAPEAQNDSAEELPDVPSPTSPRSPTLSPWNAAMAPKLDMKEIMAQASRARTSSISLGLASPPPSQETRPEIPLVSKAPKMSQKERKRQQQQTREQEQEPVPVPVPVTPERPSDPKPSPWKTPVSAPKVSMKDILVPEVETKNLGSPVQEKRIPPKADLQKPTQPVPLSPKQSKRPGPSSRGIKQQQQQNTPTTPQSRVYLPPASPTSTRRPSLNPRQTSPTSIVMTAPKMAAHGGFSPPQRTVSDPFPPMGSSAELSAAHLTLSDIISQQQLEQDVIRGKGVKPKLQEIQQEQEFLSWWDREAERYQAEAAATRADEERQSRGRGRGRGAAGSGGSGRRTKGRGGRSNSVDEKGAKKDGLHDSPGKENQRARGGKSRGRGGGGQGSNDRGKRGRGQGQGVPSAEKMQT